MAKTSRTYWHAFSETSRKYWKSVAGLDGVVEMLTLSSDPGNGEYTRLTRFLPRADTFNVGGKQHDYPEEIFIVSGRLYDCAVGMWLNPGCYASRLPGEVHGPFFTDEGCIVLEISKPNQPME